jgi:hypothetical protein
LAAVLAVWFAYMAATETRALRREDRLYRLLDLAGELGEHKLLVMVGHHGEHTWRAEAGVEQLRAGIAATGERLPGCEALMAIDAVGIWNDHEHRNERSAQARMTIRTALDELAALAAAAGDVASLRSRRHVERRS